MSRRNLGITIGVIAVGAALTLPASAAGDGAPAPFTTYGVSGSNGVEYMALPGRHGTTMVRKREGNETLASRRLDGGFGIPAVTLHGIPDGLSADGRTLVLVDQRRNVTDGPTHIVIVNTRDLQIARRLTLNGGFTFDAISPDGSTIYFIEYLSPQDRTRYAVRAYDVEQGRLLPDPIVDPDEHAGEMRGHPLERVTSADGRWAYTLYDGGDGEPFVHALDTVRGRAVCVDLDGLVPANEVKQVSMRMHPGADRITLSITGTPLAVVDTESLKANAPPAPAAAVESSDGGGGGIPWMVIGIAAAVGLAAGTTILVSRHRRTSRLAAPDA